MDPTTVEADLLAGKDEDRVKALVGEATRAGVSGVPLFIFDRQYTASGAQPSEALLEILDRISATDGSSRAS